MVSTATTLTQFGFWLGTPSIGTSVTYLIRDGTSNSLVYRPTRTLAVDLPRGGAWRGFASVARLGMRHIADGTDHHAVPARAAAARGARAGGRATRPWRRTRP